MGVPKMRIIFFSLFAILHLTLAPCLLAKDATGIYVVDVQKVMRVSKIADQGREHLAKVRNILDKAYADLKTAWEKAPEADKNAALADGARKLAAQLAMEEQASTKVVTDIMVEEIKKWRQGNNALVVMPLQNILDADQSIDITTAIIMAMDRQTPKFAELPVVNIVKPDLPAAPKKPAAKPARKAATPQAKNVPAPR